MKVSLRRDFFLHIHEQLKDLSVKYNQEFKNVLKSTGSTLIMSVYQAGKLIMLHVSDDNVLKMTPVSYPKPMGLAIHGKQFGIATKTELHVYTDGNTDSRKISLGEREYDHLYFPRVTYHVGPLDLHDINFVSGELIAVNTRFSCIAAFDSLSNFRPIWQPHFITEITPEDRCHLNGMAVEDNEPLYVTALGKGNSKQSWRANITNGGILMSIPDNEIVLEGLAMPHSPRIVGDYLYLLESARGALVRIDRKTFEKETVVSLPGLVRGLSIVNNTAFIGISKVRDSSTTFSKLSDEVKAEFASIYAIDLHSGMILGNLSFENIIQEIYDIHCFEGTTSVGMLGTYDDRQYHAVTTPDQIYWRTKKTSE